jgi:hypothetical protein
MNALEQSFMDLCAKHNVDTVSVQFSKRIRDDWFSVYVHAGDLCAGGNGETIAVALGNAVTSMNAKRRTCSPIALADEPLTELAA